MRRVHWTAASTFDLRQIRTFLSETYTPDLAQRVIDMLVLATDWLIEHPRAGAQLEHPRWRKWKPRGTRYVLVYEAVADGIEVVRVHHERNDWRPQPR